MAWRYLIAVAGAALLAGLSVASWADDAHDHQGDGSRAGEQSSYSADPDTKADAVNKSVPAKEQEDRERGTSAGHPDRASNSSAEENKKDKNESDIGSLKDGEGERWVARFFASERSGAQWIIAFAAILSVVASTVGVILLWRTLRETRAAVRAADDAVAATYTASRDQSRAYVHVSNAEMFLGSGLAARPSISLGIQNTGSTPARWFSIGSQTLVRADGETAPTFADFDAPVIDGKRWGAIGAGITLTASANVDADCIRSAYSDSRGHAVFVAGVVRYETVFGEVFETEFLFARYGIPRYSSEIVASRGENVNITREAPIKMSRPICALDSYRLVSSQDGHGGARE